MSAPRRISIDETEYPDESDDEETALLKELAAWERLEDARVETRAERLTEEGAGAEAREAGKIRVRLRVLRAALRACTSPRRRIQLRERIHNENAWLKRRVGEVDSEKRRHERRPSTGSEWGYFSNGTTGTRGSFQAPSPPPLYRFSTSHRSLADGPAALAALGADLEALRAGPSRETGRSLSREMDAAADAPASPDGGAARRPAPATPETRPRGLASKPKAQDLATVAFECELEDIEAPKAKPGSTRRKIFADRTNTPPRPRTDADGAKGLRGSEALALPGPGAWSLLSVAARKSPVATRTTRSGTC